jgi:hypothetical protein
MLIIGLQNTEREDLREECMKILGQIFKKFSISLRKRDDLFNKDETILAILNQLTFENESFKKKAINFIGSFSVILNGK